ncbi:helix-turn-helix domain-containing protein [Acaryochloris marina]|nr:helix-turn-helix transcriptional regulator [Acaryochloris marina]
MDKHGITTSALAESMGVSSNSISNMRKSEMPRLNGERLNQLIMCINQMRKPGTRLIELEDLIVLSYTTAEMKTSTHQQSRK